MGQSVGIGKAAKEGRSHHVHAGIGALGGKNGGHKELVGILAMESALGLSVLLLQEADDLKDAADFLAVDHRASR